MSDRKVKDCDRCTAVNLPAHVTVSVKTGREMDAAGSYDTRVEVLDLCMQCAEATLQNLIEKFGYEDGEKWAKEIKRRVVGNFSVRRTE